MKNILTILLVIFSPVTSVIVNIQKPPSFQKFRKLMFDFQNLEFMPFLIGIIVSIIVNIPTIMFMSGLANLQKTKAYKKGAGTLLEKKGLKDVKLVRKLYQKMVKLFRKKKSNIVKLNRKLKNVAPKRRERKLEDGDDMAWFLIGFFVGTVLFWVIGLSSAFSMDTTVKAIDKGSKKNKTRLLMAKAFLDPKSTSRKLANLRALYYQKGDENHIEKYPKEVLLKIRRTIKIKDKTLRRKVSRALKKNPSVLSPKFLKSPHKINTIRDFLQDVVAKLGKAQFKHEKWNYPKIRKLILFYAKKPRSFKRKIMRRSLRFVRKSVKGRKELAVI